jgi:hypothetical protein
MLSGLPDRPLSYSEIETLHQADAIGFVFPATPNSIRDDGENKLRVYDLLITTGETISAVVSLVVHSGQATQLLTRSSVRSR